MAKLTLTFKGKPLQVYHVDTGTIKIGRDPSNPINIDSLAVAPEHAMLIVSKEGNIIKQLNKDFPIFVNKQRKSECNLGHGDNIQIGKHVLIYSDNQSILQENYQNSSSNKHSRLDALKDEIEHTISIPDANLQVLSGEHIGRIIPLKKPLTRLGKPGSGVAVIAKRKHGYFISRLEGEMEVNVNKSAIGEKSIELKSGDMVGIEKTTMQFFTD